MTDNKDPKNKLSKKDQAIWDAFASECDDHGAPAEEEVDFATLLDGQEDFIDAPPLKKQDTAETKLDPQGAPRKKAQHAAQLDRRTEEKLKKGKMPIEGRMDLHGMTQDRAYQALERFIEEAVYGKKRCVLVITGKGKATATSEDWLTPGRGVLKQRVPEWLSAAPFKNHVLKYYTAQPKDGGSGALYVYLKRQK